MTRLARRALLLVALSVLTATATAYAECAWVVWEKNELYRPDDVSTTWKIQVALELTRFRGHPIVGAEGSVHDAEEPSAVPAGVPAADDRVGRARRDARGTRAEVW